MTEVKALSSESASLNEFIATVLPDIDGVLARTGVALSLRPHQAACDIVEHFVESIEGDTKDGFLVKEWFGVLLSCVVDWYNDTYGEALYSDTSNTCTAVVLIRHTPTELKVPLKFFSPFQENGTRWLTFPSEILPDEEPLSWLVRPPKLSLLNQDDLNAISSEVVETSVSLRQASNGILTIHREHPQAMLHSGLVLDYLERTAQDILSDGEVALSTAVWDANFAAEQAIKCYLNQSLMTKVPNRHDVRELAGLVTGHSIPPDVCAALAKMPSEKEAVKYRYSELPIPALSLVMTVYRATLVICRHFLNAHPRPYRFHNARFQMKFPLMPSKGDETNQNSQ